MPKATKKPALKPGDLVYRVVEHDPPAGEHTWRIETAQVKSCSDRMIILKNTAPSKLGLWGTRFKPDMLGVLFFVSEEEALLHFVRKQRVAVESAERAITEARRAIAWVESLDPDLKPKVQP